MHACKHIHIHIWAGQTSRASHNHVGTNKWPSFAGKYTCVYIYINVHIFVCACMYTHKYKGRLCAFNIHEHIHTYIQLQHLNADSLGFVRQFYVCVYVYIHTHTHKYIKVSYVPSHTHIHTRTHTYIHTAPAPQRRLPGLRAPIVCSHSFGGTGTPASSGISRQ
jgi:hypothetical protein